MSHVLTLVMMPMKVIPLRIPDQMPKIHKIMILTNIYIKLA